MILFRPSGGLLYHLRARRERQSWQEFRSEIQRWLEEWPASNPELILIGPSGGYTLSTSWLTKFEKIYAFDPDPLAGWFFRKSHPGVNARFRRKDIFWSNGKFSTEVLQAILKEHPFAAVLFSNVLGQLLLEHPVSEHLWNDFLYDLRTRLESRTWASYHDLYTHENGEIIDHLLNGNWKKGLPTRQFCWPLKKNSQHIIEGVRSSR